MQLSWIHAFLCSVLITSVANAISSPKLLTGSSKESLDLSQGVQKITLDYNTNELLKFQFQYGHSEDQEEDVAPQHASLTLTVDNKIEQSYILKASKDHEYTWSQQTNNLPKALIHFSQKFNKPITANLYFKSSEETVDGESFFELEFSKETIPKSVLELDSSKTTTAFASKPEIIHQFRSAPTQANAFIATVFSGIVVFFAVSTAIVWFFNLDMKKNITLKKNCGTFVYLSAFLFGILGLEYSFYQYFLGNNDIFRTLYNVFILFALPTFYTGSRLLKKLY